MQGKLDKLVNERVYKALIENGSDVHVICDFAGTPHYVSPSVYKILGYTQEEASLLTHHRFFHPDDLGRMRSGLAECLREPNSTVIARALRVRNKNNQWMWVEASLTNLLDEAEINGVIFNFRDINDRKKAQFKLLKSQLFNKGVLSSLTAHIAVINSSGTIIAVNKAWDNFAIANGSPSAAHTSVGSNYFAVCEKAATAGDGIAKEALSGINKVLNREVESFSMEYPCHSATEQRWFTFTATRLGGSANELVVSHQNITERKLAQIKVSDNERRFRGLIENGLDGIVILSADGKPNYVSPAVKSILGYSPEEAMELNVIDITHPEDVEFVSGLLLRSLAEPGIPLKSKPVRIKHKDGTWRWLDGVVTNMLHDPAINGIVDNFWDVTEQKIAENKIVQANRLYAFVSQINQAILRTNEDITLFNEVCRIAVEVGKFNAAWVGLFNSQKDTIHLVASHGVPPDAVKLFADYKFKADGPFNEIINGVDFVVREIKGTDLPELNRVISEHNYQSTILLAIRRFGAVTGILNIGSTDATVFDAQDVQLLQESTSEISFALNVFEKDRLRTQAESALKRSEARLNDAQAVAKTGSWESNLADLSVTWSAETYRIFETEEFAGDYAAFLAFVHPEDRQRVDAAFKESIDKNYDSQVEHRVITGNGTLKIILESWRFYRDAEGIPLHILGTCQDITNQKNAEEDNRFKAHLLNTIGQAAVAIDLDGVITYWNKAAENIYGWTETEAVGQKIINIIPYAVPEQMATEIKSGLQHGHVWSGELNVKRKDGSIIPVSVTDSPIYDECNQLTGSIAISSDISEKKALEKLLERANTLATIGSYELDLTTSRLYWSDVTKQIHEVPADFVPDLLTGLSFYKEGADRDAVARAVEEAMTDGTPYDLTVRIVTSTGKEKWVRAIGETEFSNGVCTKLYGSFQDIHNLKTAELQAVKLYKQKDRILESIDDCFFTLDKNWVVTYWNRKAQEVLATEKSNVLNRNLWECFPQEVGRDFYNYYLKAVTEKRAQHFEAFYQTLELWMEVSCYPSKDGLAVYFRDITERKKQEVQLLELNRSLQNYTEELVISNKGLEQFSYIISHNLRSPAANIMGIANELKSPVYDSETKELLLSELLSSVQKLDNVIVDLNNILKVKSQIDELKEPVQLSKLIIDITNSIQHIIDSENVTVKTTGILIDDFYTLKSYLYSIFFNLISNAIKYRRRDVAPVIEIKSREMSGKLFISIKDNGTGIDLTKQKNHVFGLYKRFHPEIEGKGMGLFMVKTQVEALGGKIHIKSEVNKGTEFVIEFRI
ncbi:MAG: hypothetical protein K0S09_1554 [Sphingobacteriaceae bacterium]|nr:hypothetical protein [Sphingobacteriaceae bacterium]